MHMVPVLVNRALRDTDTNFHEEITKHMMRK